MPLRSSRLWCVLWILVASLQPLHAWGVAGHHVVAMIADARLSPAARDKIRQILLDGQYSITQISTCADAVRDTGQHHKPWPGEEMCATLAGPLPGDTGPWHYIDIPVPKFEKSLDQYCPEGNCVVGALKKFTDVLRNSKDEPQRRSALLFLVHFMGDIHQPLHAAERGCDKGGNSELVNFFLGGKERPKENLHKVWDTDLVQKAMADVQITDERAYADRLLATINPEKAQRWVTASIDDIAWESHALAAKRVYRGIPFQNFCEGAAPNQPVDLTPKYERMGAHTVQIQLMKAGVRLAALLESVLGAQGTAPTN